MFKQSILSLFIACLVFVTFLTGCNNNVNHNNTNNNVNNNDTKHTQTTHPKEQIIKNSLKVGEEGKTLNSEQFGIDSKDSEIQKHWGKPTVSAPHHLVYKNKHIEFGLQNGKVIWIHSNDPKLKQFTLNEIIKIAGKPDEDQRQNEKRIIIYYVGKFKLQFVFNGIKNTDQVSHSLILPKYEDEINEGECKECQEESNKNMETNIEINPDPNMKLPRIPESQIETEPEAK